MAIIYSYPTTTNLTAKDILVLTDPETTGNPTKSATLASIASYVTGTGTGTGTTNTLTLWTDGPSGSLGDSILSQDVGATALTLNGNFISTGTGNFTGQVTIPTTPVAATDAASKNYVDTEVAGIPAGLVFKGNWDANLNSPALASGVGTVGNYYVVSVPGNTNLDGITDWQVGDWAVFVEVGGVDKWDKIDQTFVSGSGAAGQVTFWNTINTVDGDNDFYWDNVNKRLGIGTTAPETKVTIKGDALNTNQPNRITNVATDTHTALFINGIGATVGEKYGIQFGGYNEYSIGGIFGVMDSTAGSTSGDITFDFGNGVAAGALIEKVRFTHEGNVGINTASPDKKLDVTVDTSDDGVILQTVSGRKTLEMLVDNGTNGQGKIHFYTGANLLHGRIMADSNGLNITQVATDKDIIFKADDGAGTPTTYFYADGSGVRTIFEKLTRYNDNVYSAFGSDSDLRLYHDGSNSYIKQVTSATGNLIIEQDVANADIQFLSDDGAGGTTEYFRLDGTNERTVASKDMDFLDNVKLRLGTGSGPGAQDLQIYHNGSNSYIDEVGTGSLYVRASDTLYVQKSDGTSSMAQFTAGGGCFLYHNNSLKFSTTSSGIDVTGTTDTDNLTIAGAQGSAGEVLTSTGSGVAWQAGGGGGATSLNGLSDCLVDTDSLYVGESPSSLSGNPQGNTTLGIDCGIALTTGFDNTFVGRDAAKVMTDSDYMVVIGSEACAASASNGDKAVVIGYQAHGSSMGSNGVAIGYQAQSLSGVGKCVSVGYQAGRANTGADSVFVGYEAGESNQATGTTAIGYEAGSSHTSGTGSVSVGYEAGKDNTTGASRTMIGWRAGKSNTGGWNTFIGTQCGMGTGTGIFNVGVGSNNMAFAAMGNFNISVGHQAAQQLEGNENVIIGHEAGQYTSTVDDSVMVGFNAGKAITTGDQNTLIGSKAGYSGTNDLTTGADNVLIGFEAEASSATVSNEVNLYNGSVVARFQGAAAAWSFVSDARDKKDIEDLELGLDFVTKLKPRKFKWDLRNSEVDKNKNASGFVAQEVKEVLDEINADYTGIVDTNNSEQYTVSQSNIIPMLVNAVKELKEEIEQLKKS